MADLKRALRGAYPGAAIESDASLRAALADLGHTPVVYGWIGAQTPGTPTAPPYADRVLALSPIAYYKLDEASGTTATDSSGNAHDGTYSGATPGAAAGIGDGNTAAAFDGTGDYIDISAMAAAFSGAHGSILVWGQTSAWADSTTRYLARIAASGTNQVFIQKTNAANTVLFRHQAGGATRSVGDTSLAGAASYFSACLTWDTGADELKAYLNGAQVGTTQTGLGVFSGTPAATITAIGAIGTSGASSWNGSIAHTAIFDRALTGAEVLSLGVL